MKISDWLNPTVISIAKPEAKNNPLAIAGRGLIGYLNEKRNDEIKDLNLNEIKKKVVDEQNFLSYMQHRQNGGSKSQWFKNNSFLTPEFHKKAIEFEDYLAKKNAQRRLLELSIKAKEKVLNNLNKPIMQKISTTNKQQPKNNLDVLNEEINRVFNSSNLAQSIHKTKSIDNAPQEKVVWMNGEKVIVRLKD